MQPIKLGVLGLGRAFTLMIPTLSKDPRIDLVACFDTNAGASAAFSKAFGGTAHNSADALCADPNVEWIYVATPHQLHEEHVRLAAKTWETRARRKAHGVDAFGMRAHAGDL